MYGLLGSPTQLYLPAPTHSRYPKRAVFVTAAISLLPLLMTAVVVPEAARFLFSSAALLPYLMPLLGTSLIIAPLAFTTYHYLIRPHTTPLVHPARSQLAVSWLGIVLSVIVYVSGAGTIVAFLGGILLNVIVLTCIRRHLVTEMLFAGFGLAGLFLGTAYVGNSLSASPLEDVWFGANQGGFSLFTLPVFQVEAYSLLAFLVAPVYLYLKDPPLRDNFTFRSHHLLVKRILVASTTLLVMAGAGWFSYQYSYQPQSLAANYQSNGVPPLAEIALSLARPVRIDTARFSITPDVPGTWEIGGVKLNGTVFTSVTFKPERPLASGAKYTLQIQDMRSLFRRTADRTSFSFQVIEAPTVTATAPPMAATDVALCAPLSVTLSKALPTYWKAAFTMEPATDLTIAEDRGTYSLTPATCLEQNREYTLDVHYLLAHQETGDATRVSRITFRTVPPPGLTGTFPSGTSVLTTTDHLDLVFTKAMATSGAEKYLAISPPLPGSWEWVENGITARFRPSQPLKFATKYTVTAKLGLPDQAGGHLVQDAAFTFTTIGPVRVAMALPKSGSTKIGIDTNVLFRFDQEVDHASAESHFSIVPATEGSFSWNGNELSFRPRTPLPYNTKYTATMKAGVVSVPGQPLVADYSLSFTTKPEPPPPPRVVTFGLSEQGRAISGTVFGKGKNVLLLMGAIHGGQEKSSGLLMERLVQELRNDPYLVSKDKTVIVLPVANPDGYLERTDKFNSRGVNLNINFDTTNWQPYGGDHNDFAGEGPFSEKESRVIRDLITSYGVSTVVSFHAQGGMVNPEYGHKPSQDLAKTYAKKSGYAYYDKPEWDYPGTATRWFKETIGGPAITVELTSRTTPEWSSNRNALLWLVE